MSKIMKRRKGRKSKDSPIEKKFKEKDGEVAIARGRLAGALKGILNHNTEDSDDIDMACSYSSGSNSNNKKAARDTSPGPWKKLKPNDAEDHQSYFMKLFDRSVDLAQFDINTPLYPICRAWIQNKPILTNNVRRKKDEASGLVEIKHEADNHDSQTLDLNDRSFRNIRDENDLYTLPPPKPLPEGVATLKIPNIIPSKSEDFDINIDPDKAPSREELLQSHLKNWANVRRKWRMASHENEARYAASKEILTKMFERAQVQFHVPVG